MQEIWKPVNGYEGLYMVSNMGRIKSLFRYKKILKHNVMHKGYCSVELFKNKQSKRVLVHRIVAKAFLPNPDKLPMVNHKDENPRNNVLENLEWCTAKYNQNYGTAKERRRLHTDYTTEDRKRIARENGKARAVPVVQIKDGEVIGRFENAKTASVKTGINHSHILEAAHNQRRRAGGYHWKFERS